MKLKEKLASSRILNRILYNLPYNILSLRNKPFIVIEPNNYCNLKCKLCFVNRGMTREKGDMSLENFKKIVDEISYVKKDIALFFAGEPLMNKDIFEMVKYASSKKLNVNIDTNGMLLNKFEFTAIITTGLKRLDISLDGATNKTYLKYQEGGDFNLVIENVKNLCFFKNIFKYETTSINIGFVVMKHNEHEIGKMKELCRKLGVNSLRIKTLAQGIGYHSAASYHSKGALEEAKEFIAKDEKYRRKSASKDFKICPWIWQSVILWNGDITICCGDFNGDYVVGNIFKDGGFKKIWKSKKYGEMRRKILNNELKICKNCSLPFSDYNYDVWRRKENEYVNCNNNFPS